MPPMLLPMTSSALVALKVSAALFVTNPVPRGVKPTAPPLPTLSVPAVIVVPPVYVLAAAPVRNVVPVPVCVSASVPRPPSMSWLVIVLFRNELMFNVPIPPRLF